jgi:hypothetical protein
MALGGDPFTDWYLRLHTRMLALDPTTPPPGRSRSEDTAELAFAGGNPWQPFGTWAEVHDLAIVRVTAPRTLTLRSGKPSVAGKIKALVQNQGRHPEVIADSVALQGLITVAVEPLDGCPAPAVAFQAPARFPITLAPKAQLMTILDATFTCAGRYRVRADLHHAAIDSAADRDAIDDTCPRVVSPPFRLDPNPDGTIKDRGCGARRADRTFGDDILIDVVVK